MFKTNRVHVAVGLFNNRSRMKSKCGKNNSDSACSVVMDNASFSKLSMLTGAVFLCILYHGLQQSLKNRLGRGRQFD